MKKVDKKIRAKSCQIVKYLKKRNFFLLRYFDIKKVVALAKVNRKKDLKNKISESFGTFNDSNSIYKNVDNKIHNT